MNIENFWVGRGSSKYYHGYIEGGGGYKGPKNVLRSMWLIPNVWKKKISQVSHFLGGGGVQTKSVKFHTFFFEWDPPLPTLNICFYISKSNLIFKASCACFSLELKLQVYIEDIKCVFKLNKIEYTDFRHHFRVFFFIEYLISIHGTLLLAVWYDSEE